MHTKRISITLYTANAKVTKHPKFLPMKHGNKNRELKAAERTDKDELLALAPSLH